MLIIKEYKPDELPASKMFEYAPGVELWIRPLKCSIVQDFRKKCTKTSMQYNAQSRGMEPVEEIDTTKFNDLLADYILEKWNPNAFGKLSPGGTEVIPLDINLASKKLILDEPSISDFVRVTAQSLDTTEAESKNSQTSPTSS